ncbi:Gti1/Pac2 family-domain-containing protein [Leucosporidium creatinivorum]|uniref:Gti1/Pac2 family-domain-containing protein n=1 Tax=Leucosporidium creatinivorum TaxID=106004 RepID=A0A1Y2FZB9_9BASI|nr:Gti1/Pac2 family-domain-containing protein [Leucosporidium creatinivorum]
MVDGDLPASGHSYFGQLSTVQEAHAILEASRQGLLPRVTRRLTDDERVRFVRPGAVFVWEEEEAGIRRWTDHIKWSPSRVSGAFLTYTEVPARGDDTLIKQSFSSVDARGTKMHLIAYTTKTAHAAGHLPSASRDPLLQSLLQVRQRDPREPPRLNSIRPPSPSSSSSRPSTGQSPTFSSFPSQPALPPPPLLPSALYRHPSTPHLPSATMDQRRAHSVSYESALRPRPSSAVEGHHRPLSSSSADYSRPLSSYASFATGSGIANSYPHAPFDPSYAAPSPTSSTKPWQFAYSVPPPDSASAPSPMDVDPRAHRLPPSSHGFPSPYSPIDPYTRQLPPLGMIASGLPVVGDSPPTRHSPMRTQTGGSDDSEGDPPPGIERRRGSEDERQLRLLGRTL